MERYAKTPIYLTEPQGIIKIYEKKTDNELVLESTAENGTLSLYRAVLSAFHRLHGISAHFVARDERL